MLPIEVPYWPSDATILRLSDGVSKSSCSKPLFHPSLHRPGLVPQTTIVRCLHHLRPHHCGHSASQVVNLLRSSHSLFTDLSNHRILFVDRRGESQSLRRHQLHQESHSIVELKHHSTHECSRNCCAITGNKLQVQEEHIEELFIVLLLGAKL
jgi:hypothetical protein